MEGDERIDRLMKPVLAAIKRNVKNSDAVTEIYNRAYEALMNSMDALDVSAAVTAKQIAENAKNLQRAEKAEAEIAALQAQLKASNDDADRLASELEETYAHNDIYWEEPGESSPALIAHKLRLENKK